MCADVVRPARATSRNGDDDGRGADGEGVGGGKGGFDVFVADVTPVGQTTANIEKKLINANVAIELSRGTSLGEVHTRTCR